MSGRTHGRYSGWNSYRYGEESNRRQPYLAKRRPTIVPEKERRELVGLTADILATAELSKFEHEASCRHGIRTTLTLQGNGWQLSDAEAASIVTAALDRIGAVRPQFLEGQPEYTLSPGHQCQRCGAPLGDEAGHRRYCSPECYESARRYRNEFWQRTEDIARAAAAYATAKANAAVRQCSVCGSPFQATTDSTHTCSRDCAARSRRTVHERECAHCGETFRPHSLTKAGKFCSPECHAASRRQRSEQSCLECGEPFLPAKVGMKFCCHECSRLARAKVELPPKVCRFCGHDFTPKAAHALFCTPLCKERDRMRVVKLRREAERS
jgi:hypothetical protein